MNYVGLQQLIPSKHRLKATADKALGKVLLFCTLGLFVFGCEKNASVDALNSAVTMQSAGATLPQVVATPENLDFGAVQIDGETAQLSVILAASSIRPFTIRELSSSNSAFALAAVEPSEDKSTKLCNVGEIVQKVCELTIGFAPTAVGEATGNLTISYSGMGESGPLKTVDVPLSGLGVGSTQSTLTVTPRAQNFGTITPDDTAEAELVVSNLSKTPLFLTAGKIDEASFSIVSTDCPSDGTALPIGAVCKSQIAFSPQSSGDFSSTFTIAYSYQATDAAKIEVTSSLVGSALDESSPSFSAFTFTPLELKFDPTNVGSTTSAESIAIKNRTKKSVAISSLASASTAFVLQSHDCPLSPNLLAPNQSCSAALAFAPTARGEVSSQLQINYRYENDSTDHSNTATVNGTGRSNLGFAGLNSVTQITTTSATLNWTAATGSPAHYQAYRVADDGSATVIASVAAPVTSMSVTGLTAGTTYKFRVRAFESGGVDDGNTSDISATTLVAPPAITSVSPANGSRLGGTTLTINGSGFSAGATVSVGGSACSSVVRTSANQLSCQTPSHASGTADIVVTNADTQSATLAQSYYYSPVFSGVASVSGISGNSATVNWTASADAQSYQVYSLVGGWSSLLKIIAAPATSTTLTGLTSNTTYSIRARIIDTNGNSDTNEADLSFTTIGAPPTISSFSPTSGPKAGGGTLTINGTNFSAGATVALDGTNCGSVTVVSSSQITCVLPARAAGGANVRVTNADSQIATSTGLFTYVVTFGGLSAISGITGNSMDLSWTASPDAASYQIYRVVSGTATYLHSISTPVTTYRLTGLTPNTTYTLRVRAFDSNGATDSNTADVTAATLQYAPPTISSITPSSAAKSSGGTVDVTISGTGFRTGATATIGGSNCTSLVVQNDTTITCRAPALNSGSHTLVVANSDAQSAISTNAFTYSISFGGIQSISSVAGDGMTLNWNTTADAVSYNIYSVQSGVAVFQAVAIGVASYRVTGLTANTSYTWRVRAVSDNGSTDSNTTDLTQSTLANLPPTVSSLSQASGLVPGAGILTIIGTNFQNPATVTIGGTTCTSPTVLSSTMINCVIPSKSAGTYDVRVTNTSDSQYATLSSAYTYWATPTVTSASPASGTYSGGTSVHIFGTGFESGITATLGGVNCPITSVASSTEIVCTTGSTSTYGAQTISVTNTDGKSGSLSSGYNYLRPAPTITSLNVTSGPTSGGTAIIITGNQYSSGATVAIGGVACTVTATSATTISCTTGLSSAGAKNVVVTGEDGQTVTANNAFTYNAPPTISSISPSSGTRLGGSTITINGTNFNTGVSVDLDGACGSVTRISSTQLTCVTAGHASGSVNVTVTNTDSQSVTSTAGYYYSPVFAGLTSVSGVTGNTAVANWSTAADAASYQIYSVIGGFSSLLKIVSAPATSTTLTGLTSNTSYTIRARIVDSSGNADVNTADIDFTTIGAPPTISSISPTSGPKAGGGTLTITGTNFNAGTTISVGANACGSINVVSSTQLMCTIPARAAGSVYVTATNPDSQTATSSGTYDYIVSFGGLSSITSVTGSGMTLNWTNTSDAASYQIYQVSGGTATYLYSATAPASSYAITGLTANSSYTFRVRAFDSSGASDYNTADVTASTLQYLPPTVSSISPTSAAKSSGGTVDVTISGTNFRNGATATIGGSACTSLSVASSTSITCRAPALGSGSHTVVVTNSDSQSSQLNSAFTYTISFGGIQSITAITGNAMTLGWNSSADAVSYNIYTVSGGTATFYASVVGSSSYQATGLSANTSYTWRVRAVGDDGATDSNTTNLTQSTLAALPPTVTSVSQSNGLVPSSGVLTVVGTNFQNPATVTIGGTTCTSPTVLSSTAITCIIPSKSAGTYDVRVTNTSDSQYATLSSAYTYWATPTVTSATPASGTYLGGTSVTVYGTGFQSGVTAAIGGVSCSVTSVVSTTELVCTTGSTASYGSQAVAVTNTDGKNGSLNSAFSYLGPAPTITSLDVTTGSTSGNTAIVITGTNYSAGATVAIGNITCTVTATTSTTLSCTTGASSAGAKNVVVTGADGQTVTSNSGYTYVAPPGSFSFTLPSSIVGLTTPKVQWTASANATSYDLKIATTSNCASPTYTYTGLTTTSKVVDALSNGSTYYACITAKNGIAADNLAATNSGLAFLVSKVVTCDSGDLDSTCVINSSKTITASAAIYGAGNLQIESGGALAGDGDFSINLGGSLIINGTNAITTPALSKATIVTVGDTTISGSIAANIGNLTSANITISGSINAAGLGYAGGPITAAGLSGYGPCGGGGSTSSSRPGGGGGHAGAGGNSTNSTGCSSSLYGSATAPVTFGSGGGGGTGTAGGNGGGVIRLTSSGTLNLTGSLVADGAAASNSNYPGGSGAGGSIYVDVGSFSGNGSMSAAGAAGAVYSPYSAGDGGGGRIAVAADNYTYSGSVSVDSNIPSTAATSDTGGRTMGKHGVFNTDNVVNWCDSGSLATTCQLSSTRVLGTSSAVQGAGNLTIKNLGTLKTAPSTGRLTVNLTGDLTVENGGTINANMTISVSNQTAANIYVNSGGSIDASGKGYRGGMMNTNGEGPGAGIKLAATTRPGSGGCHGGLGGRGYGNTATDCSTYDTVTSPATWDTGGGSGGGGGTAGSGGAGGGYLYIYAPGTIDVSGSIKADGASPSSINNTGGAGAGGSLYLTAATLTGSGTISAAGGNGHVASSGTSSGDGGGGLIAFNLTTMPFTGTVSTLPGRNVSSGNVGQGVASIAGTGAFNTAISNPCDSGTLVGTCIISSSRYFGDGFVFTGQNLTVQSGGNIKTVNPMAAVAFLMSGDIDVQSGGAITANIALSGSSDSATNFTISGSVNANGLGYYGGPSSTAGAGASPGNFLSSRGGGGGAHGGTGGAGGNSGGAGGTPAYGTAASPINGTKSHDYGSGGAGNGTANTTCAGGHGGGAIRIKVSNSFTANGSVTANGAAGTGGCTTGGGGGAGGSVWITASTITGSANPSITANGGAGGNGSGGTGGGGGGGGRINIDWSTKTLTNTPTSSAGSGGTGTTAGSSGSAGTVYNNGA